MSKQKTKVQLSKELLDVKTDYNTLVDMYNDSEKRNKENKTGTIVLGVLCGCSVIINFVLIYKHYKNGSKEKN